MSFTLEIVFIGLVAVVPAENMVLLPKVADGSHQPLIVLRYGECTANDGSTCFFPLPQQPYFLKGLAACEEEGCTTEIHLDDYPRLVWYPFDQDVEFDRALRSTGDGFLDDVVSVDKNVWGPAWLNRSCRGNCESCSVWSRVSIPADSLATCHRLHVYEKPLHYLQYKVGGSTQRVADAFWYKTTIPGRSIDLVASPVGRDTQVNRVTLEPIKREGEYKVTLFIVNEDYAHWTCYREATTSSAHKPPASLKHFVAFHQLIAHYLPGRNSRAVPELVGYSESAESACEAQLRELSNFVCSGNFFPSYPHGGSECEAATIP